MWIRQAEEQKQSWSATRQQFRDYMVAPLQAIRERGYWSRKVAQRIATILRVVATRAERYRHPIGIIMIDIDHFKKFNDMYGHQGGDLLLRELGTYLEHHVRKGDIACRYGGEEFTLIMPESDLKSTQLRAEELRTGVKELNAAIEERSLGPITLSLDVAVYPQHGKTAQLLLQATDSALYEAKAEGRDCVVAAQ